MTKTKHIFNRKKALLLVFLCAVILVGLIIFRWAGSSDDELMTAEGREKFLSSLGWQVDMTSEAEKTVIIPEKLEGVMEEYNKMQLEQGLDLSSHCGEKCRQYTYLLKNYPSDRENIFLTLYIQDGALLAGDIHTNSANGFMQGIYPGNTDK